MVKLWDHVRLIPTVARLASRAPRDPHTAWDRYWNGIRTTGPEGDVLWDSGSAAEHEQYAHLIRTHFDPALPVIDVGCGNGTHTRWLAGHFPRVVGVDVSPDAVERAASESRSVSNADFLVLDAAQPGAGKAMADTLGPANVFVRGVFHVLKPDKQAAAAANIRTMLGDKGHVFIAETNYPGNSLAYLSELGATADHVPPQLQRALENLPRPGRFGAPERQRIFPQSQWQLIADGPVGIDVVGMGPGGLPQQVPGYFAVMSGTHDVGSPGTGRRQGWPPAG